MNEHYLRDQSKKVTLTREQREAPGYYMFHRRTDVNHCKWENANPYELELFDHCQHPAPQGVYGHDG